MTLLPYTTLFRSLAMSQWFSARFGTGNKIVADRYTGLVFGSFGLQKIAASSAGFPVYDLYLAKTGATIDSVLLDDLSLSGYDYLIVDARMAVDRSEERRVGEECRS